MIEYLLDISDVEEIITCEQYVHEIEKKTNEELQREIEFYNQDEWGGMRNDKIFYLRLDIANNSRLIKKAEINKDASVFYKVNGSVAFHKMTPEEKEFFDRRKKALAEKLEPTFYSI